MKHVVKIYSLNHERCKNVILKCVYIQEKCKKGDSVMVFVLDDKGLSFYNVQEGDRLFLFTKKSDKAGTPSPGNVPKFAADLSCCTTTALWDKLRVFLQRHFTPQDVEKVLIEFQKVGACTS